MTSAKLRTKVNSKEGGVDFEGKGKRFGPFVTNFVSCERSKTHMESVYIDAMIRATSKQSVKNQLTPHQNKCPPWAIRRSSIPAPGGGRLFGQ